MKIGILLKTIEGEFKVAALLELLGVPNGISLEFVTDLLNESKNEIKFEIVDEIKLKLKTNENNKVN